MLADGSVRLRPWCREDLPMLTALRNDVEVQRTLLARPRPADRDRVIAWLRRVSDEPTTVFFVVALDDEPVGFVQLHQIDRISGHAHLGIALSSGARGRGVGGRAMSLIEGYGQSVFELRKILLEVLVENSGARALYERRGYRCVGTMREHFRWSGRWLDVMIMEKRLETNA